MKYAEILQTIGLCFQFGTFLVVLQAYLAIHERTKKQSTLDSIIKLFDTAEADATQKKHLRAAYSNKIIDIQLNEADEHAINMLLYMCESISVGINSRIYDKIIFTRLAGYQLFKFYNYVEPYIANKRSLTGNPVQYGEFTHLCNELSILLADVDSNSHIRPIGGNITNS